MSFNSKSCCNEQYDAMVIMWVRKSELANGLDKKLFSAVHDWLDKEWLFKTEYEEKIRAFYTRTENFSQPIFLPFLSFEIS